MKKYKAYIHQQGEGCDYTIGCAQTVIDIEANSMDEAKQKLFEEIEESYSHEEQRLESAELYEIEQVFVADMDDIYKRIDNAKYAKEQERKEAKERQEFERLKSKFGV